MYQPEKDIWIFFHNKGLNLIWALKPHSLIKKIKFIKNGNMNMHFTGHWFLKSGDDIKSFIGEDRTGIQDTEEHYRKSL